MDMTVGDFNDPVKGKSLGRSLLSHGSDVIIQIAGNSGIGVIELFKNNNGPALLISSDIDIEDDIPGKVLTCVMKRLDNAVYSAIKNIIEDKFEPGYYNIGLQEDAVGITNMRHTKKLINPDVLTAVNKLEEILKKGKFKVPASEKEMKLFNPSIVADYLNGKKK
jgi:basic membrane protein A